MTENPKTQIVGRPRTKARREIPRQKSKAKYADDPSEPNRCHASNNKGARCRKKSVPGMTVCRSHGGLSPGRPCITGAHSKVLNDKTRILYEEGLGDAEMLYDLNETLALTHVVLSRAIERAQAGDVPEFRTRALEMIDAAFSLGEEGDTAGMKTTLDGLRKLLKDGVSEDTAVETMNRAIEKMATRKKEAWGIRLNAMNSLHKRDLDIIFASFLDAAIDIAGPKHAQRIAQRLSLQGF